MFETFGQQLTKARRRLWMKYALRGVGGSDNHARLDLARVRRSKTGVIPNAVRDH